MGFVQSLVDVAERIGMPVATCDILYQKAKRGPRHRGRKKESRDSPFAQSAFRLYGHHHIHPDGRCKSVHGNDRQLDCADAAFCHHSGCIPAISTQKYRQIKFE